MKRLEIAEKFGLDVREVSEIVKRLIEKRGKLIGSDSAGYWIPKDMDESKRATQNIRKRFISLAVRLKKLHNWSDEEFSDQLLLALKEKEGHRE
ncbi:MAG: hypothetical protein JW737_00295 [Acidobacteria bacterium]|nr:hypothetical protein [Acidobacteriota bacterium]